MSDAVGESWCPWQRQVISRPDEGAFSMGNLPLARPEILLKTDKTIVLLELKHDGKFAVKTNGWEDSRVIREGKKAPGHGGSRPLGALEGAGAIRAADHDHRCPPEQKAVTLGRGEVKGVTL
jgi:hypothetical protein